MSRGRSAQGQMLEQVLRNQIAIMDALARAHGVDDRDLGYPLTHHKAETRKLLFLPQETE